MKILHIGKWYPWTGGIETVRDNIVISLSEKGIDCDILCESRNIHSKTYHINEHATAMTGGTWFKFSKMPISPPMITKLRKIANNYDIIHLHQPDPFAVVALKLSGFDGKVVTHWHADLGSCPSLHKFYHPLLKWSIERSDVIVSTTMKYAEGSPILCKYLDKVKAVPIGIDCPKSYPKKVNDLKLKYTGKRIIFSMGRLVTYKGFEYLIQSAIDLPNDCIVLIGGKGPLKESLQQKIDDLKLNDKVNLLGYISNEEVSALYDICDVFCMPSIHKGEAFGIVQIEAMAHSKPVVTTKIPGSGVDWVNEDEVTGINVEIKDSKALSKAINRILVDQELRDKFGANAKRRFDSLFTREIMINKMLEIYKNLEHGK